MLLPAIPNQKKNTTKAEPSGFGHRVEAVVGLSLGHGLQGEDLPALLWAHGNAVGEHIARVGTPCRLHGAILLSIAQAAHLPQTVVFSQLRYRLSILAMVVLPTPVPPVSRMAAGISHRLSYPFSWLITVPCPARSENFLGRYSSAQIFWTFIDSFP